LSPAQALLNRLAELGAVVEVADNGRLVIRAVLTTISKEIVASARVLKAEIIELIQASATTPASAIAVAAVSNNGATANTNRDIIHQAEPKFIPTAPTVSENGGTSAPSKPDVICRTQTDRASQKFLRAELAPVCPPSRDATALHNRDIVVPLRHEWSTADWQAHFDERAGIIEFDGDLPRPEAEARAFEYCVLNRNLVRSAPDRCLACGAADHAHDALLPFGTETTGHAWLHSRCWPAWHAARKAEAIAALATTGIDQPRTNR